MTQANQAPWLVYELGIVTIEFVTAFMIGAGADDNLHDDVFVTDANGLPCLPGTSLAGVLRHAIADEGDAASTKLADAVFGYQQSGGGMASNVRLSFAQIHDSDDRPVAFRASKVSAYLQSIRAGVVRDHVRLSGCGVAAERGKFDELLVPAGTRFTFELCVSQNSPLRLNDLLAVLARADLRIGRRSTSGLGKFEIVRARAIEIDLRQAEGFKRLSRLPVGLHELAASRHLNDVRLPEGAETRRWLLGRMTLRPIGTWYVGGITPPGRGLEVAVSGAEAPTRLRDRGPHVEPVVVWNAKGQGAVTTENAPYVVPGSTIKGALRHRVAFHLRRLAARWLEDDQHAYEAEAGELLLFGEARRDDGGAPGRVFFSDATVAATTPTVALQHVALDRFTQGPVDHLLFDELALGDCELQFDVAVRIADDLDTNTRKALKYAFDDLCAGRLSIGAGRGHGRFLGSVWWHANDTWLKEIV
jgi:CRISPR/Cas system CSM-associated protein Csm3 (group 7 of RAMP superfamily)